MAETAETGIKYILINTDEGTMTVHEDRPKQADVGAMGVGTYELRRGDGRVAKTFEVTTNRNGNPKVVGSAPRGLDGISTARLATLERNYVRIVRIWTEKSRDLTAVQAEIDYREGLVRDAMASPEPTA